MILFITKDLFFIPVLQSAGANRGITVQSLLSVDSPKLATLELTGVTTCVIDLSGVDGGELSGYVGQLRALMPQARLAAFGPHVHADKLAAASDAGVDHVLTRGQLTKQIDQLVIAWDQPTG